MIFTIISGNSAFVYAQGSNDVTNQDTINIHAPDPTMDATVIFQEEDTVSSARTTEGMENDTIYIHLPDSARDVSLLPEDTLALKKNLTPELSFKPSPKRAVIYSAILPGLGQIYNRKYWKLPIVYGGYLGFAYAISWNHKTYQDYNKAYKDYYHDKNAKKEDWYGSWISHIPIGGDEDDYINMTSFETHLRSATNYYRRYRDLSIILAVAWYFICMADAYVDAQLFDFDISPDLSMRIEPVVTPKTRYSPDLYGINLSFKF